MPISTEARKLDLLRSWLFLPGADRQALMSGPAHQADVLVQELEDFTPPEKRPQAHAMCMEVLSSWREQGVVTAVRVNPLGEGAEIDLRAVMAAGPDIIMMSKVADPREMVVLDALITALERELGHPHGRTLIVPNIESARGIVNAIAIAQASPRIKAMLVATEDTAADLGADRTREGLELLYPRARFLLECTAAGVSAIDCPYTYQDREGAEQDMRTACSLGYKAKAVVNAQHVAVTNRFLTPDCDAVLRASRCVHAFEAARRSGLERVEVDGLQVEVPSYLSAKRLLIRHEALRSRDLKEAHHG